jgi:protein phosphatase
MSRASASSILIKTPFRLVHLDKPDSCAAAVNWWSELTSEGREGMVVKPMDFIATGRRGITQSPIKCRGPEYLRIIHGPEYLLPENLERRGICSGVHGTCCSMPGVKHNDLQVRR